jgi:hypothetical protein
VRNNESCDQYVVTICSQQSVVDLYNTVINNTSNQITLYRLKCHLEQTFSRVQAMNHEKGY